VPARDKTPDRGHGGPLRAQLRGRALTVQLTRIEHLNIPPAAPVEHRLSIFTLQSIAVRIRFCPSSSPNSIRNCST